MSKPTPGQINLFTPEQRSAGTPPPIPPPPRIAATVTEQLPADLVAAGWRVIWRTERYNDGWFYAANESLGLRTADHIYVKHRGFKYAIRNIANGQTQPLNKIEEK